MKILRVLKIISSIVIIITLITVQAACAAEDFPSYSITDKKICLKQGIKQFSVRLPSNPSTGYSWFLKNSNSTIIKLVKKKYFPPKTNNIGAPGTMVFVFEVLPGKTIKGNINLIFVYKRPFNNEIAKVKNYLCCYCSR